MTDKPAADSRRRPKRAYVRPVLVRYGDASTLTLGKSAVGKAQDGGGKSKMRTR